MTKSTVETRALWRIAKEIKGDWKNVSPHAKPYLDAMEQLDKITDNYYEDSASSIVAYFRANSRSWTGETAKRVKKELDKMLKDARG